MNLAPLARLGCVLGAWALFFLASPGVVCSDGSLLLALAAAAVWVWAASRPGRKALLIEWLAAAIGLSAISWWTTYVLLITLLAVALVPALYVALSGVLLRRLARRWPLALAAPAAWMALETLRGWVEPPLGFGWLRLAHHATAHDWLVGSARVWGGYGLGWAIAALAGGLAAELGARFARGGGMTAAGRAPTPHGQAARNWIARALATGPLALAVVLSLATSAPPTVPGPRFLLVQPAFEQQRKMNPDSSAPAELVELTRRASEALPERPGRPRADLVGWGESMISVFGLSLASEGVASAWQRGLRTLPWDPARSGPWAELDAGERQLVQRLLRERHVLPAGAAFLSGAEMYLPRGSEIRRTTAAALWGADGQRLGWGAKLHLVPGGETMAGLERWAWVRDTAFELAGYVPDLVPAERTEVVALPVQGMRAVRLGLSVCFDNAFDDPYVEPLRRSDLDFHVILSNEAWYVRSCEYDQMLAFTRLITVQTGRSMVRITNSGVTALFGPDGHELARLVVNGEDRMVGGSLCVDVPIPAAGQEGERTPFVQLDPWLRWLCVLLPLALLALRRPAPVTPQA